VALAVVLCCSLLVSVVGMRGLPRGRVDIPLDTGFTQLNQSPESLLEEYSDLISSMDISVFQCDEGVEKLNALQEEDSGPYVVNAMLTAVGPNAEFCSLANFNVNKDPPKTDEKVCIVHCGEDHCGASLQFINDHQEDLSNHCEDIMYFQGGAKCFVEKGVELSNVTACAEFTGAEVPCDAC